MPGMDGFESTRLIRDFEKVNKRERTPIVAMTAHVQSRDKALCLKAGMNDFIPKPFDPAILQQILTRYVSDGSEQIAAG
jgi:CheY-like chemotaxis protein